MKRRLEPELMVEEQQVRAYAKADFETPHNHFVQLIREHSNAELEGKVLELGCGPGDVTFRFALAFPACRIDAIDGSEPMFDFARAHIPDGLENRIRFLHARIPTSRLPEPAYGTIISNSLLHHLHDPRVLWSAVLQYGLPGTQVFIMDLLRPDSKKQAKALVSEFAANEPEILRQDFYNSLLAAFTMTELNLQLKQAALQLSVHQISNRHVFVYGIL